jgi:hypothetical protein
MGTGVMSRDELAAAAARATTLERRLGVIYRELGPLRVQIAELRGPAELPKRRYQTDTQQKVARCPRCGEQLP